MHIFFHNLQLGRVIGREGDFCLPFSTNYGDIYFRGSSTPIAAAFFGALSTASCSYNGFDALPPFANDAIS